MVFGVGRHLHTVPLYGVALSLLELTWLCLPFQTRTLGALDGLNVFFITE